MLLIGTIVVMLVKKVVFVDAVVTGVVIVSVVGELLISEVEFISEAVEETTGVNVIVVGVIVKLIIVELLNELVVFVGEEVVVTLELIMVGVLVGVLDEDEVVVLAELVELVDELVVDVVVYISSQLVP